MFLFFNTVTYIEVEQSEKKCNTKKPNCNYTRAFWWCWIKMGVWKKIRGYRKFTTLFIARSTFLSGLLMQMKLGLSPNQRGESDHCIPNRCFFWGADYTNCMGWWFFWKVVKRVGNFRALRTPVGLLFSNPTLYWHFICKWGIIDTIIILLVWKKVTRGERDQGPLFFLFLIEFPFGR